MSKKYVITSIIWAKNIKEAIKKSHEAEVVNVMLDQPVEEEEYQNKKLGF